MGDAIKLVEIRKNTPVVSTLSRTAAVNKKQLASVDRSNPNPHNDPKNQYPPSKWLNHHLFRLAPTGQAGFKGCG